jgi:predicted nucleotidyltransferase
MDFRRPLSVVGPTLDGDVLGVLAGAQEEFTGRRIHRVLGHGSEEGVRRAADRLVTQGIVNRRHSGQAKLYSLNRSHLAAPYVEGLGSLRAQLIRRLKAEVRDWRKPPAVVFLFGSVARGDAGTDSDLDLFVVRRLDTREGSMVWQQQLADLERNATDWTGNAAQAVEYGKRELADPAVRAICGEVLEDGVAIYGSRAHLRNLLKKYEA